MSSSVLIYVSINIICKFLMAPSIEEKRKMYAIQYQLKMELDLFQVDVYSMFKGNQHAA